jgi:hypothetical protein
MSKIKKTIKTDFNSFRDKNNIQICPMDEIHFIYGDYIQVGVVTKVEGKYIHIDYDPWGTSIYKTRIMDHNCKYRVIIIKGEMLKI